MFYPMGSYFLQSQPQPNRCTLQKPFSVQYINPRQVISPTPNIGNLNYKVECWTHAHQMTIEQTFYWIWTFGHQLGWGREAANYAQAFKRYKIDGERLQLLTHQWLKGMLICDYFHRQIILDEIKRLFPPTVSDKSVSSSVQNMEESSSEGLDER